MVINEVGCVVHKGKIHWDRCEDGHSVFKCDDCGLDVDREAEDSGCGG